MTMVLPSWVLPDCLLAAVAMMRDKLTAIAVLATLCASCWFGRLTRSVDLGHHKASEDGLVEGGIGTA